MSKSIETTNEKMIKTEEEEVEEEVADSKLSSTTTMTTKRKNKKTDKLPKISIDLNVIPSVDVEDDDCELRGLGITAFDQRVYEENVMLQVDKALDITGDGVGAGGGDHSQSNQTQQHQKQMQNILNLDTTSDNKSDYLVKDIKTEIVSISDDEEEEVSGDNSNDIKPFKGLVKQLEETDEELSDDEINDERQEINVCEEDSDDRESDDWRPTADDYESDERIDDEVVDESDDQLDVQYSDEEYFVDLPESLPKKKSTKILKLKKTVIKKKKVTDDGDDKCFQRRIKEYKKQRLLERHENIRPDGTEVKNLDELVKLDNGFQLPKRIWDQLYAYQQTGVKWLWELHGNGCGGIVGDEMGLGKTIQVISFLCGLSFTKLNDFRDTRTTLGPVLLVCPATVMHQWVAEFHKWWPYFRVAILHQTGSHSGKKETLIRTISRSNGILITSYSGVCSYQKHLLRNDWHYVILDEGHKIRNPLAQVTHTCKLFTTPHRLILSGSPIQNNLRELWSLFDFIYPGKLGSLQVFTEHFSIPITMGGYANATDVQIQVAFKMATILRDTIMPFLLRRSKQEVQSTLLLPSKNEQVLFCKLTTEQRDQYKSYIDSTAVKEICKGSHKIFVGLINLRKICNHPNLFQVNPIAELKANKDDIEFYKRSGKMRVVEALLRIWYKQKHKVLVFTQSRKMISILECFLHLKEYTYLLMDGSTSVQSRQSLIKQFNEDPKIFVFLLTTRVGGIGVNLTGANRVLIYDPDWNPSTDMQARERCWRIGQNKAVTIYRLLSSGTVEEKIYQRQIFKQYLTNKVLKDPKQRRFFKTNDLYELFTLGSESSATESSSVFAGTDSEIKLSPKAKKQKTEKFSTTSGRSGSSSSSSSGNNNNNNNSQQTMKKSDEVKLSAEKVVELRNRAKLLSKLIAEKFANNNNNNKEITLRGNENNDNRKVSEEKTNSDKTKTKQKVKTINEDNNNNSKKSKKGTQFEGKRIKYLIKQDVYKDKTTEENNESKADDEYVLKKLFRRSKVQSALQHDVIECSSAPDYAIAEREAETVAKQAIAALKRSRETCLNANPLTGVKVAKKFGLKRKLSSGATTAATTTAATTDDNKVFTSSSLINDIKSRNRFETELMSADSEEYNQNQQEVHINSEYDTLLSDIRNFIAFQSKRSASNGGEATTQEVLDAFRDKLPPNQSAIFKSMLYQLCQFYRTTDGVGVWKLKPEFR
ncbi:DNA excision repair protein ERCC-6-like [Oppia nitens]|uniref:DNA excision repair protein ERCC-6-like n=1 Tax=Oppia nitens TaxID=1686743 RepID=UPI0023DB1E31|nr:DNA excision repair protein ERCC-6-like [Oppia nitens]